MQTCHTAQRFSAVWLLQLCVLSCMQHWLKKAGTLPYDDTTRSGAGICRGWATTCHVSAGRSSIANMDLDLPKYLNETTGSVVPGTRLDSVDQGQVERSIDIQQ
jgi:hypothetical protein